MPGHTELSPTALLCLDRQLAEALDLAVWCHLLTDRARCDGSSLTAVVLERLASDLADQAGALLPLAGAKYGTTSPPLPEASSSGSDWLAELDNRLGQVGLVAELDAMSPGLEASVARLLSKLAELYRSSRELLLAVREHPASRIG